MTWLSLLPWVLLTAALGLAVWLGFRLGSVQREKFDAEKTRRETENQLRRISQAVESASDAIGIGDFNGTALYLNHAHRALFGYSVEELNALPESGALFADKKIAAEILQTVKSGRSWSGETEVLTKDGRRVPALVRADVILDEAKKPVGIFGVFTDITERRRAVRNVESERQRLAVTLQSIAEGVITIDANGRVELINRAAEKLTGWTQAEALRLPLGTVFNLLDEMTREPKTVSAESRPPKGRPPSTEISAALITRDGTERTIVGRSTPLPGSDGAGAGTVIVFRDVTNERRESDEHMRESKLESLGLLAGGIAHDFSNLLTGIMGQLSLAQTSGPLNEETSKHLKELERAAWRARDLTQQLLTFAKGEAPLKKVVSFEAIIREAVGFALHNTPHVAPRFVVPKDLWLVEADPAQLGQVISNLSLNAAQAMGKRGTLLIMAENLEPGGQQGLSRSVHVSVTDTGAGIPPENLPKLFDPFFTTKSTGTGLGLAMVYSIIKRHGGRIHVDSTIGYGTTFHINLPAAPVGAVAESVASGSPFLTPADRKDHPPRVLLMDDESEVRETVGLMLILLGYEVETAREGQEAIELFRQARNSSRPFSAVILDLRVPDGLGGAETIRRLRAIDPKLKALVASGYSEDPTMSDYRGAGFDATIAKPFNLDDLQAVIEGLTAANR